jgi:hypothetical protein
MSHLAGAGTWSTGSRRLSGRILAVALAAVPLAAFSLAAGCGGGGGSGSDLIAGGQLLIMRATPTNGQETLPDLSDIGLDGRLRVEFSVAPRARDILDPTNPINGLTSNVQILDQTFNRVPGSARVDPVTRTFEFTPYGGSLTAAQYTATFSKFVAASTGDQLNLGQEDFSTSWTVGPDIYPPVIRNSSPSPLLSDVALYQPVVVTFNESLDPASVVLGQTVIVEDGGTNPPTALLGTLRLDRGGFDIVFTPDPCAGMPPATTIVFRMLAFDTTGTLNPPHASVVRDLVGNQLQGDTATPGEVAFQFNTRGTKRLPDPTIVHAPSHIRDLKAPAFDTAAYASTGTTTFAFDVAPVMRDWAVNGTIDPALTVPVKADNFTWWITATGWQQFGPFGGDWESKLGQAGEAIIDWRYDLASNHSYIYQLDEAKESVAIINTGTGKIEGHLNGVGTPKGIGINGPLSSGVTPTLYITNYGQGTLTAIPIGTIIPGLPICTAVKELSDDPSNRRYMLTGRNPSGVAFEYWGTPIGAVVNQADDDMQVFDPGTLQPVDRLGLGTLQQHYTVGENPLDVCWSPVTTVGVFAYVVAQGGEQHPKGSFSLWLNNTSIGPFAATSGAVQGTIEEGMNVPGRPISDPLALSCYVPNTAGDDISKVDVTVYGSSYFVTAQPKVTSSFIVGENPTKMTWTGYNARYMAFASLAGQGQVAVWEKAAGAVSTVALFDLPGVRSVFSDWDQ